MTKANGPNLNKNWQISRRLFCAAGAAGGVVAALGPRNVWRFITNPPRTIAEILEPLAAGLGLNTAASPLSQQFIDFWKGRISNLILGNGRQFGALSAREDGGFYHQVGDAAYVERKQDRDTVSEATGYMMKTLTNASLIRTAQERAADNNSVEREYQQKFNKLFNGAVASANENGLMSWRMEYQEATDSEPAGYRPVSLNDRHSASDADIYIAWSLIHADNLVRAGIWRNHPEGRDFYREKAAEMLSKIKGLDIIEKHGRKILAVSDGWGHKGMLRGDITINPSYIILAALRDFAEFDLADKRYWLEVRRDNFEILEAAVNFSQELYQGIADPALRNENLVAVEHDGSTYYVMDSAYRDLTVSLLHRSGKELTDFGIEDLLPPSERIQRDTRRREAGDEIVVQQLRGKLIIKAQVLDEAINIINDANGAHPVPFVPDQLEVVVEADSSMRLRIEMGEGNLPHTENYDGIRGPKELGEELITNDDRNDATVPSDLKITERARTLLGRLVADKTSETVRANRDHNLVPLTCYLVGTVGLGDSDVVEDFETGFGYYVASRDSRGEASNRRSGGFPRMGRGARDIFDMFRRVRDSRGNQPRYYSTALGLLSLTVLLADQRLNTDQANAPQVAAYGQRIRPVREPEDPLRDVAPSSRYYSDNNLLDEILDSVYSVGGNEEDATLTYLFTFVENDLLHGRLSGRNPQPHYPEIARKIYHRAHVQVRFYPNDPEVLYLAAAASRNVGLYRQAANEFYKTLLRARFEEQPLVVLAAITNIEITLGTLGYGHRVIGDIFESILDSPDLSGGTRLAIKAAAVRQFNQGGNHVKAFRMAIEFLTEYQRFSAEEERETSSLGRILRDAYNYTERTASPRQRMLIEVVTSLMELLTEYGRMETRELEYYNRTSRRYETHSVQTVSLSAEVALQVPDVIERGARPTGTGEVLRALELINELRSEIPVVYRSRLTFAKAKVYIKLVAHRDAEILRLKADGRVLQLDDDNALLMPLATEALEYGELAEQHILEGLEQELAGERNVFVIQQMLNAYINVANFVADRTLRTLKDNRTREIAARGIWAMPGTLPPEREYVKAANASFQSAILANIIVQRSLEDLTITDYLLTSGMPNVQIGLLARASGHYTSRGIAQLREAERLLANPRQTLNAEAHGILSSQDSSLPMRTQIRRTIRELGTRLSPDIQRVMWMYNNDWTIHFGLETITALRQGLARAGESLSPQDAEIINQMEKLVKMYNGRFFRTMRAIGKGAMRLAKLNPSADPRNVLGIMYRLRRSDLYLSWAEVPPETSRRARLEAAQDVCDQVHQVYLSNREHWMDLTIDSIIKSTLSVHKLREMERRDADRAGQRWVDGSTDFLSSSRLFRARFAAMLEGYLPEDLVADFRNDPIVNLFVDRSNNPVRQNQRLTEKVFQKFPKKAARAWANYGNASWWGTNDATNFQTALRYYARALEFDPYNIDALRGWLQIYSNHEMSRLLPQETAAILRYRYFRRALESVQRGGVDEAIISDVLNLPANFPPGDPLRNVLIRTKGSNDQRVRAMLGHLLHYGY